MSESKGKTNITELRHPEYKASVALWELLERAYLGGKEYVDSALVTHRLEHLSDFRRRQQRATLLNYLRPICDAYANYTFRPDGWEVTNPPAALKILTDDADGKGTDWFDWWKGIAAKIANLGYGIIGVDMPVVPEGERPRNLKEQESKRIRPYLYWVNPIDLLDWQVDLEGQLVAAMVREPMAREIFSEDDKDFRFRVWYPDRWELYDSDGDMIGGDINRAGVVPLVPVRFRNDGAFIGLGLGQDLEPLQADILNMTSCLQEILYRQTFSQLVAQGGAEDYGDIAKMGTSSIWVYPEGMDAPQFISPDASQADLLMRRVDNSRDEIYRLAQLTTPNTQLAQVESGVAIALKFVNTNEALGDFANNLMDAMTKVLSIAGRWVNVNVAPGDITIEKPADFGVTSPTEEVDTLEKLYRAGADPAVIKAQERRAARALFPKDEELLKYLEELEKEKMKDGDSDQPMESNPFPAGPGFVGIPNTGDPEEL